MKEKHALLNFELHDPSGLDHLLTSSEGRTLTYRTQRAGAAGSRGAAAAAPERWEAFWMEMDELGIWEWPAEFADGPAGSPRWSLRLRYGDNDVSATGTGEPMGFAELVAALEALLGRSLASLGE